MMKHARILMAIGLFALLGAGCEDTITTAAPEDLAPPLGLRSVTGNGAVTLSWNASNYGENRQGFQVFQASGTQSGTPEAIPAVFGTTAVKEVTTATAAGTFTTTVTGLNNGVTYSFLVVAFKDDGDKISRPSNIVVDTPRRETPTTITLVNGGGSTSFLDVDADPIQPSGNSSSVDIQCQSFNAGAGDRHGMVGRNGALIQDLGYKANWDEVDKAPLNTTDAYPAASFSVQVLKNHVYAVYTGTNHYAKIWVTELNTGNFGYTCRVAYQPQEGNNELKPGGPGR